MNMRHMRALAVIAAALLGLTACNKEIPKPEPVTPPSTEGRTVAAQQLDYSAGAARKPRSMVCHDGKVYVSCGYPPAILRIDTASGQIDRMLKIESDYDLEGMVESQGKLFVASSFIQTTSGILYDNIVIVVDINSFSIERTIAVPKDPDRMKAVDDSHIMVLCGNGLDAPLTSVLINTSTYEVQELGHEYMALDTRDGTVYAYSGGGYAQPATYYRLAPLTNSEEQILASCGIEHPYSINCIGEDIYLTTNEYDGSKGDVIRLGADGTRQWSCEAGMLPSKVVPVGDGTAYVLNQGNWGENEASLSRVAMDNGSITNNIFSAANGRALGDVAQDLVVYGSKAYITVSFSNTVEIINTKDNTATQIAL